MSEPVILRVKLPPSSPVIHKTFKVNPSGTVSTVVRDVIGKSLQQTVSVNSNFVTTKTGLFLPNQNQWLADDKLIADVQAAIAQEEYVEFKDRELKTDKVLLGSELTYALIGFLVGCVSTFIAMRMGGY